MTNNPWTEQEYVEYLAHERHMYAWCLVHYKGMDATLASNAAVARYPYEEPSDEYRGLVFHNDAWHWAMLHIFGETYWVARPDLEDQSREYQDASAAFEQGAGI